MWDGESYDYELKAKIERKKRDESDRQRQKERKEEHARLQLIAGTPEWLQVLLVETAKEVNATDELAQAHDCALGRLEKSGLVANNDTQYLHTSVVSVVDDLTWMFGSS